MFLDDEEEDIPESAAADPLMDTAVEIVVSAGKASGSYLQRRLKIGYSRAARLVEAIEAHGIVGPANGSKPRQIRHVPDLKLAGE
jgi:S-DNA-T family DNA segregation ATPase FtsK/SpoIIIE